MDSLRTEREQMKQLVMQAMGRSRRNAVDTGGALRVESVLSDMEALPFDDTGYQSRQITDPNDPNFGKKRFISGVSSLSGNDIIA
jgi:hypothetical protein